MSDSIIFFSYALIGILSWFLPLVYVIVDSKNVKNRENWIILTFFFGLLGAILYLTLASRSTIERKTTKEARFKEEGSIAPSKSELMRSAMKALDQGDKELAKKFIAEAEHTDSESSGEIPKSSASVTTSTVTSPLVEPHSATKTPFIDIWQAMLLSLILYLVIPIYYTFSARVKGEYYNVVYWGIEWPLGFGWNNVSGWDYIWVETFSTLGRSFFLFGLPALLTCCLAILIVIYFKSKSPRYSWPVTILSFILLFSRLYNYYISSTVAVEETVSALEVSYGNVQGYFFALPVDLLIIALIIAFSIKSGQQKQRNRSSKDPKTSGKPQYLVYNSEIR